MQNLIKVIYHINRRKDKNHMIVSIEVRNTFDEMQEHFIIKHSLDKN